MIRRYSSVSKEYGNIVFTVNYYTELLGVIYILSNNQKAIKNAGCLRKNEAYRNSVLEYFKDLKNNKVTKLFEMLSEQYFFNYNAPVNLLLQIGLDEKIDREKLCIHRVPIEKELFNDLLIEINDFEINSKFKQFYEMNKAMYLEVIKNFINDYKKYDPLGYLIEFLDIKQDNNYIINFMFGITDANYGVTVGNNIYANLRPYLKSRYDNVPDFSFEPIYYTTLVLHEFAHSFINPIVEELSDKIYRVNHERYISILNDHDYGDNIQVYIAETIIRAIESLYVKEQFPDKHIEYVQGYIEEGFILIEEVEEILTLKQNNTNIKSYLNDIVKLF